VRFIKPGALAAALLALAGCAGRGPDVAGQSGVWEEWRLQAARKIAGANAGDTFNGPVPDVLRSIPVMQVHLNADGSVRDIEVQRMPKNSPETVQMARRAIQRAAPFAPVGHLPRPWQYSETFLYNEDLKFQLRTLAESP
jgi:hypothetical protein